MSVAQPVINSSPNQPQGAGKKNPRALIEALENHFLIPWIQSEIHTILKEYEHPDLRILAYQSVLHELPDSKKSFMELVQQMRKKEDTISLESAIRLYGPQNTGCFILTELAAPLIPSCKTLQKDPKTGRTLLPSPQLLKWSIKVRKVFGENGRYKEVAFSCGFLFDWLTFKVADLVSDPGLQKKILSFLEARITHAIENAKLLVSVARERQNATAEKEILAIPFLVEFARIWLAVTDYEWMERYKKATLSQVGVRTLSFIELDQFGCTATSVASIAAMAIPNGTLISKALLCVAWPEQFVGSKEIYDTALTALLTEFLFFRRPTLEKKSGLVPLRSLSRLFKETDDAIQIERAVISQDLEEEEET